MPRLERPRLGTAEFFASPAVWACMVAGLGYKFGYVCIVSTYSHGAMQVQCVWSSLRISKKKKADKGLTPY